MDELGVFALLSIAVGLALRLNRLNPIFGYSRRSALKLVALAVLAAALVIGLALHHLPLPPASGVRVQ